MAADLGLVQNMLMGQYNDSTPVDNYIGNASTQINNLTNKRVRDLLSRQSNSGMSRSGIGGVALNDVYAGAGEQLSNVAGQGEVMQQRNSMEALGEMGKIAQYEDQKPNFADYLGSTLAGAGSMALGSMIPKWLQGSGGGSSNAWGDMGSVNASSIA